MFSTCKKIYSLLSEKERRRAWFILCLMLIGMILETLGIGLVIPVIAILTDANLDENYPELSDFIETLGFDDRADLVIISMLALICLYLLKNTFLVFQVFMQMKYAFTIRANFSQRLFSHYLHMPYSFHLQHNSSKLIWNILNGVSTLSEQGVIQSMFLITECLVLISFSVFLLLIEPVGALLIIVLLGSVVYLYTSWSKKYLVSWSNRTRKHDGFRLQHIQQGLGSVKEIKILGREQGFLELFGEHNRAASDIQIKQSTFRQTPRFMFEILAISAMVVLVITMLLSGRDYSTITPVLGVFAAATFRLMPSANRMLSAIQSLRFSEPIVDAIHAEFATLADNKFLAKVTEEKSFKSSIALESVCFRYPGENKDTLKDISLEIKQGESVGFIGPTGSGKSTLIDLLLALTEPRLGSIKIDGCDLKNVASSWQQQIGYVPQSIYLTDDTIRCNIAFGVPEKDIDDDAVVRALRMSRLLDFVQSLEAGMETIVGEQGVRLSGGQRQRVGLARALYHDPDVLVFDEATSALDVQTEKEIVSEIQTFKGQKTLLVIAHRLTTVENCDCIYQLESGRISNQGSPAELLGGINAENS